MSDNCNPNDCPVLPRVEALEEANRQHSATHREMFGRLGALERISDVQENKLDNIEDKLDDIQADNKSILQKVEALESKPGKRWDSVVDKVLLVLVGTVAGYILFLLGLSV